MLDVGICSSRNWLDFSKILLPLPNSHKLMDKNIQKSVWLDEIFILKQILTFY
jgi:hypothetical protein